MQSRFPANAAVLQAEIRPGVCLNLLNTTFYDGLQETYNILLAQYLSDGRTLPENVETRNYLDQLVINNHCKQAALTGTAFQTVRGGFREGRPVYEGSRILRESHVQIAVRDPACIVRVEKVK